MRCGLSFDQKIVQSSSLYSALRALANRRNEQRIAPNPDEGITMVLKTADGQEVKGSVRDISANGARIMVGGDFDAGTIGLDSVALSFQLPSEDHSNTLTGVIRNQQIDHDQTYLGVIFDENESEDFKEQQRDVMRYLMRRQRELIRK